MRPCGRQAVSTLLRVCIYFLAVALVLPTAVTPSIAEEPLSDGVFKRKVVITGYYSPLPDQPFYITGSYAGDVRLNGRGTNGASGKEVYPGMIAAPKDYPFGTRISIPGIGLGTVHDRGGAIISNYRDKVKCPNVEDCERTDRLDLWCGFGMEGLARALYWIGVKRAEATIYPPGSLYASDSVPFPYIDPTPLVKRGEKMHIARGQGAGSAATVSVPNDTYNKTDVQKLLVTLGYLQDETIGTETDEFKQAVYVFQKEKGLVESPTDSAAGYPGPQTRSNLSKALKEFNNSAESRLPKVSVGKGSSGDVVEKLQLTLKELGYYSSSPSRKYDTATIDAVYRFQIEQKLIGGEKDPGAGYFGAKTRDAVVEALKNMNRSVTLTKVKNNTELAEAPTEAPHMDITQVETFLSDDMSLRDSGKHVERLQEYLQKLGYLNEGPTGYFGDKTYQAIFEFQKDYQIVQSEEQRGAGVFGPATRARFASIVTTINSPTPAKKVEASKIMGVAKKQTAPALIADSAKAI